MFSRQIDEDISISLSVPQFAEDLFELVERNRAFLSRWLPWVEKRKIVDDHRAFLLRELNRFVKGEALHTTVFYRGAMAGSAELNNMDLFTGKAGVGYWLGEEFLGKRIITSVVKDLISVGTQLYSIRRFEIAAASENLASRKVAERLGFRHEGTQQRAYRVADLWFDQEIYGLLIDEKAEPDGAGPFKL